MMREKLWERRKMLWLLLGITVAFIWGNSLMPASVSGAISQFVKDLLKGLFGSMEDDESHGLVRKLAHMAEFAALGVELFLLGLLYHWPGSRTALSGLCVSLFDETIQLFVSGRNGAIRDVWIDMGGFALGVVLCMIVSTMVKRKRKQE